ncbi:putative butyrophilin subfamily 2 member A3 isoform X2 [Pelodiscus sinensis]|uniref:putative butyrophilin subfamily 2 member A3 isoform X2 n=1 Tax=Pelodiscus sinensis TaxID=13735 RepID=UPI003F6A7CCD
MGSTFPGPSRSPEEEGKKEGEEGKEKNGEKKNREGKEIKGEEKKGDGKEKKGEEIKGEEEKKGEEKEEERSICRMLWSNCCKHKICIIGAGVGTIAFLLCYWKRVKLMKENEELQKEKLILKEQIEELQKEKLTLKERNDQLQKENEWRKARNETDNIILDAVTAHPNLSISSNKKSFTHEAQPQNVPPNPERFDASVCVLGSERFSSGKHYWEVDVENSTEWDLGVARKSIQRKGKLSLSPKEGFWALSLNGKDYWAKTDPWTRVTVQKNPQKIGVYLNYKDRQVTFFNVTDMSVLFTFSDCSFSEDVCPFFKNSHRGVTMRICSIKEEIY